MPWREHVLLHAHAENCGTKVPLHVAGNTKPSTKSIIPVEQSSLHSDQDVCSIPRVACRIHFSASLNAWAPEPLPHYYVRQELFAVNFVDIYAPHSRFCCGKRRSQVTGCTDRSLSTLSMLPVGLLALSRSSVCDLIWKCAWKLSWKLVIALH